MVEGMKLHQFLRIVEIRTKIVSVSSLLIGTLGALYIGHAFSWLSCLLLWTSALAVDMGTTAFNSFFDYYHKVDTKAFNLEKDKVIIHEKVAPGAALLIALGLYALAAILGLILALNVGWELLAIGALCMAVGFFYNGGPLPLSRTPLGELFAGGFLGYVLPLIAYFVFNHELDPRMLILALPSFLLVASILTVNNTCDQIGDTAAGRKTLTILIGHQASRFLIPLQGLAAWFIIFYMVYSGLFPVLAIIPLGLGLGLSLPLYRAMDRRGYSHATKGPSMGSIAGIFQVYTLAFSAALLIAILLKNGIN